MVGAGLNGILNFALVVVVTRGLGAGRAGAFFEATALFVILSGAAQIGSDTGLLRFLPSLRATGRGQDLRRTIDVALWPVLAAGALLGVVTFVFARPIADLSGGRHDAYLATLLRTLAPFLPLVALHDSALAATRGFGTMVPTVVLDKVARPAVQPLLILAVAVAEPSALLLAYAWAGPYALAVVIALLWLAARLRRARRALRPTLAPSSWKVITLDFWRFSAPRAMARIFQLALQKFDIILVGALRSTREAGIYAATTRYVLVGLFAIQAIQQAMQPKISELLARRELRRANSVYQVSTGWLMVLSWPFYLLTALFAHPLLMVFGRGFVAGETALVLVSLAMLLSTAAGAVDVVLLMAGRSSWSLFNTALALAIDVGLDIVLVPRLGITGAGIGWAAAIAANNIIPLLEVWVFLGFHPFGRGFRRVVALNAACFVLPGLAARLALGTGPIVLGAVAVFGGLAYFGGLWMSRGALDLDALPMPKIRRRQSLATG